MNDPADGVAVSTTSCPNANGALQVTPQLMPAGLVVIVTLPGPDLLTVSVLGGIEVKVAVQLRAADIVTLPSIQSASPDQPANMEPGAAAGVSSTICPLLNGALHLAPQLIPPGSLVTVPVPVPVLLTDKV
jgi:hypothetical protein